MPPNQDIGNGTGTGRPPATVLVVEPDPGDRALLASVFAAPHWRPHWALSYRQAIFALIRDRMTAILCERYLPDGSWMDILSQTQILPDPPCFIVADTLPDSAFWAEVLNLGGYDVLAKPFVREEVERVAHLASMKSRYVPHPKPPAQAVLGTPRGLARESTRAAGVS